MKAEYRGNMGCLQRDSVERKGYAGAQSTDLREGKERNSASDLFEGILDRNNLNRAYKPGQKQPWRAGNRWNDRRRCAAVVEGTQGGTDAKPPGREIYSQTSAAQRNSQTRWRGAKAGNPNGNRPGDSTGNRTKAPGNLRAFVSRQAAMAIDRNEVHNRQFSR